MERLARAQLGCSPTTPSPSTCSVRPLPSVICQWRAINRAGTAPAFWMRML